MSLLLSIKNFIRKNKTESLFLIGILIIGLILRIYKIDEYMTFLGDEGRDAIVVMRLLKDFDPILVGPGTSVGNMYLGPFYYYLMAPFLLLFNFSPIGPAIMIALFSVATIYLVWYFVRVAFYSNKKHAVGPLSAATLYAVSPVVINLARFSWNPNIMPFFALLLVISIWKFWHEGKWRWFVVGAVSLAITFQSHYMSLLLIPIFAIFFLSRLSKDLLAGQVKKARLPILTSLFFFLFIMSPLVIFDARHGWRNFSAMGEFFLERRSGLSFNFTDIFSSMIANYDLVITRLLGGADMSLGNIAVALFTIFLMWLLFIKKEKFNEMKYSGYVLILAWFVTGIIGLGFYRLSIFDHYFGFLFPAPFILVGAISQDMYEYYNKYGKYFAFAAFSILLLLSILNHPFRYSPNNQLEKTKNVAKKIRLESEGKPFNIAVIAERNYEAAYWYFLELWGEPIVGIDPLRADETITEQLFVICEYEDKEKCQPTSNPKTEVANFGWSKIDESWFIKDVILYKLSHNFPSN